MQQSEFDAHSGRSGVPLPFACTAEELTPASQRGRALYKSIRYPSSPVDASGFAYVVGIDIGSQTCDFCVLKPDKSQVIKSTEFADAEPGFEVLHSKFMPLGVPPEQVLIGLEATSAMARTSSVFRGPRLPAVPAASSPNPSICTTAGLASENRSHRCDYDCPRVTQWQARRGYVQRS